MHYYHLAVILLIVLPWFASAQPSETPVPAIRLFADLQHEGKLAGPWEAGKLPQQGYCITVPLPDKLAALPMIPHGSASSGEFGERLARLRIEAATPITLSLKCNNIPADQVRLYRRTTDGWEKLAVDQTQSATLSVKKDSSSEVAAAVLLPSAPNEATAWPTRFEIEVKALNVKYHIPCRVAPFLIPSSLDPTDEVLIADQRSTKEAVTVMSDLVPKLGLKLHRQVTDGRADRWMQDTIEPGQFSWPTTGNSEQLTGALVGTRKAFRFGSGELDAQVSAMLRARGIVTITPGDAREKTDWIDWYGNLETSPPFVDRQQKRYPYGRLLTGKQRNLSMHPGVMRFLQAQSMQWPPIVIDTSWLMIGHVDEVVNFVPARNKPGFRVLVPSPQAAREMLDGLISQGHGEKPIFPKGRSPSTVSKLQKLSQSAENRKIDETVSGIEKQLMEELNLEATDVVRLPVVFDSGSAVIPNAVNSLIVNGHMLIPEPCGPIHQEKDLFAEAIRIALKDCAVQVTFVDAWNSYHVGGGELHCGTNAFRRLSDPAWWKHVKPTTTP